MKLASITSAKKTGSVTAPDALFGAKVNADLLAQAIRVYRANARQGTSKVQNRSEVTLTKSKWYRQKGTGNARHGAKSAPIFVGGGVAHGPTGLENWSRSLSRKMKAKALISALSAQAENIVVVDALTQLTGKTKEAADLLKPLLMEVRKVLVVLADRNEKTERALANIPGVSTTTASLVNAFDIAAANKVLVTKDAITALENRLLGEEKPATKKAVKTTSTEKTALKKAKTAKKKSE